MKPNKQQKLERFVARMSDLRVVKPSRAVKVATKIRKFGDSQVEREE